MQEHRNLLKNHRKLGYLPMIRFITSNTFFKITSPNKQPNNFMTKVKPKASRHLKKNCVKSLLALLDTCHRVFLHLKRVASVSISKSSNRESACVPHSVFLEGMLPKTTCLTTTVPTSAMPATNLFK